MSKRELFWVASAKKDLKMMPDDVQDIFGFALYQAQLGQKHIQAKPMKGFSSANVLEVIENSEGNTYRAVYTVRYKNAVYVLHCLQKKSSSGIATPKPDMRIIHERLRSAELHSMGVQ